jgi:hypothetical protein
MNSTIHISFMTDEAIETLRENSDKVSEYIKENKFDSSWIAKIYDGKLFDLKKEKINDFELKLSPNDNYKEVELENAIILYEALKDLPRYIITDERFWAWINLSKCYKTTTQAMPIKSLSTFKNMWLFTQGKRRGIFFGANSRLYFWTELTVDESIKDKYLYTRFVFENHERIRQLTWRANSNNKRIVLNVIKAEKKLYDNYANDPEFMEAFNKCERGVGTRNIYTVVSKYLSLYGSVRVLDVISDEDLQNLIYMKLEEILFKVQKGAIEVFSM